VVVQVSSLWTKFYEELKASSDILSSPPPLLLSSRSTINLGDLLYRSLSLDAGYLN
jgi:hypothetical protein